MLSSTAPAQVRLGAGVDDTQTHAWGVYKNSAGEIVLVHLPPRDGSEIGSISSDPAVPGEMHAVRALSKFPVAITGIDDRVFLVFPEVYSDRKKIRRVFSGRAIISPVGSVWSFAPSGRLESQPAITAEGELVDLIATSDALWALLKNVDRFTLLTMTDSAWEQVELPAPNESHIPNWTITAVGSQLIAIDLADENGLNPLSLEKSSNAWTMLGWPGLDKPAGTYEILAGTQVLFILDSDSEGHTRIRTWSRAGVFTIAEEVDVPEGTTFAMLDSVNRLIGVASLEAEDASNESNSKSQPTVRVFEIDLSDGSFVYSGDPIVSTPVSAAEFRFLLGMMILIMSGVLVVVIMPDRADAMQIPDGFALADPGRRLMASIVDLFVISFLVGLIFDVRVIEIVTLSVIARSDGAWMAIPSVMLSGVGVSSIMEWIFGATPGKFLMGIRVMRAQSGPLQRIPFWAGLVRNMIKWILPPVAALALVDPEMLHRGDRATRTIVASVIEPPIDIEESDSGG